MSRTRGPERNDIAPEVLALQLTEDELVAPLDLEEIFVAFNDEPAESYAIEIGTGNGYLLEAEAARLPVWRFIGIEREPKFYWKMVKRCARTELTNVRTYGGDAFELIDLLPPASLDRIYCYFSDPWPKRRHADRRVVGPHLLPHLERLLKPHGEFWYKSDVHWFFNLAVTAFREREGWEFTQIGRIHDAGGELDPDNEILDSAQKLSESTRMLETNATRDAAGVVTNFERKGREAGRQVWAFHARQTFS